MPTMDVESVSVADECVLNVRIIPVKNSIRSDDNAELRTKAVNVWYSQFSTFLTQTTVLHT